MTPHLHGAVSRPVALVIGTWDPFSDDTERSLRELARDADRRGLDLAAVMFDPAPATFLFEEPWYPFYNDRYARLELLRASGVTATVVVDFEPEDIKGSAHNLFDLVGDALRIRELYLGPGQSLGRGDRGSRRTINRIGRERGFRVVTWQREGEGVWDAEVRQALHRGAVSEAVRLHGRPPLLSARGAAHRAEAGTPWTWPCGAYDAVEVEAPTSPVSTGRAVRFELRGDDRDKRAVWSHDIGDRYVAVLRGPGDDVARAPRHAALTAFAA